MFEQLMALLLALAIDILCIVPGYECEEVNRPKTSVESNASPWNQTDGIAVSGAIHESRK